VLLATLYVTQIYPDAPREYRSASRCRDGGELDIDRSPVWPLRPRLREKPFQAQEHGKARPDTE
jgi:hypothetical protein